MRVMSLFNFVIVRDKCIIGGIVFYKHMGMHFLVLLFSS